MTSKRTDLAKLQGIKIENRMKQAGVAARFAQGAATVLDKREQRNQDRALGLVPFAVKLNQTLVTSLHEEAQRRGQPLNELVAELLGQALAQGK